MGSESERKRSKLQQPLSCITNCFGANKPKPSDKAEKDLEEKHGNFVSNQDTITKTSKHGGWKAIIFILGNETFERLASFGLLANFMVYLLKVFHMDQVSASNIINIWSGLTNFGPLLGAFISDTYVGRFKTIAFASFASLLGMATITLTTWLPQLHPPPCANQNDEQLLSVDHHNCKGPNNTQLGFLLMGLCILSVGSAGIRPCSIPFGVDQFDPTTDEGKKGINSFFNWYYTSFTVVLIITSTVVVYIQDSVSWVLGFAIPTSLMFCSIVLFFIGMNMYTHVKPEGSIFSSIAQVFVAAYKKRKLKLPADHVFKAMYYDPPLNKTSVVSKLPHTNQYRFFDKAAIITDNDVLNSDGCPTNKWRLCSIQEVEEVKCLVRITPVWASGVISLTSITQSGTFLVSQALNMDRHLGSKFQIPAGSINVISMITIGIWLPFYDRFLVPSLRRITKHEGGITLLQRIGIGIVFSIIAMVVAGFIEKERRVSANLHITQLHHHQKPMSVFWLAPQLILLGLCEAFNIIGQIEFFNRQFPEHMRSIANSLFSVSFAGASYFSSILITIVHRVTGTRHKPDWLTSDINVGRIDYFYFLIAGIGVINLLYFLYVSRRYHYKGSSVLEDDYKHYEDDLELTTIN